jgi:hypothetical protein
VAPSAGSAAGLPGWQALWLSSACVGPSLGRNCAAPPPSQPIFPDNATTTITLQLNIKHYSASCHCWAAGSLANLFAGSFFSRNVPSHSTGFSGL